MKYYSRLHRKKASLSLAQDVVLHRIFSTYYRASQNFQTRTQNKPYYTTHKNMSHTLYTFVVIYFKEA